MTHNTDYSDLMELDFNEGEVNWDICPTCGHESEEDSLFCEECGTRLRYEDA